MWFLLRTIFSLTRSHIPTSHTTCLDHRHDLFGVPAHETEQVQGAATVTMRCELPHAERFNDMTWQPLVQDLNDLAGARQHKFSGGGGEAGRSGGHIVHTHLRCEGVPLRFSTSISTMSRLSRPSVRPAARSVGSGNV